MELFIEEHLNIMFPDLEILYNDRTTIGLELDIYIPTLQFAVEINGIFHYEPIFGKDKLNNITNKDKNKTIECYNKQIDLCVIDVSKYKYFKEKSAMKYLNIIKNIIISRL